MYTIKTPNITDSLLRVLVFCILILPTMSAGYITEDDDESIKLRMSIVKEARRFLGTNYKYGGEKPSGFDCSGFTSHVFSNALGIKISRTSEGQAKEGQLKPLNELKAGDLVFFGENKGEISHVAIVVRNSTKNLVVIHSTSSGGVMLDDINYSNYWEKKLLYGVDILSEHNVQDDSVY